MKILVTDLCKIKIWSRPVVNPDARVLGNAESPGNDDLEADFQSSQLGENAGFDWGAIGKTLDPRRRAIHRRKPQKPIELCPFPLCNALEHSPNQVQMSKPTCALS